MKANNPKIPDKYNKMKQRLKNHQNRVKKETGVKSAKDVKLSPSWERYNSWVRGEVVTLHIYVVPELRDKVKIKASQMGLGLNNFVTKLLEVNVKDIKLGQKEKFLTVK